MGKEGYGDEVDEFLGVAGGGHEDTVVLFIWQCLARGNESIVHERDMGMVLERGPQMELPSAHSSGKSSPRKSSPRKSSPWKSKSGKSSLEKSMQMYATHRRDRERTGMIRSARCGDIGPLRGEGIDLYGLLSRVLSGRNGGLLLSWC